MTIDSFDVSSLQWRHNGHDGVSNLQPHDCLLNHLFKAQIKETSKLRVTGLCVGISPVTGEFPAQRASNAENATIDDVIMSMTNIVLICILKLIILGISALYWWIHATIYFRFVTHGYLNK